MPGVYHRADKWRQTVTPYQRHLGEAECVISASGVYREIRQTGQRFRPHRPFIELRCTFYREQETPLSIRVQASVKTYTSHGICKITNSREELLADVFVREATVKQYSRVSELGNGSLRRQSTTKEMILACELPCHVQDLINIGLTDQQCCSIPPRTPRASDEVTDRITEREADNATGKQPQENLPMHATTSVRPAWAP